MLGDLELQLIRPDNPARYGLPSFLASRFVNLQDPRESTRFVDNPNTMPVTIESSEYHLNRKYKPYVTPFLFRDAIVKAFLQREHERVIELVDFKEERGWKENPLYTVFESLPVLKTPETDSLEAVFTSFEAGNFPVNPGKIDEDNVKALIKEDTRSIIDRYGMLDYRDIYLSPCSPEHVSSGLGADKPYYRNSFSYIPRCLSDGRFSAITEFFITGGDSDRGELRVDKIENLDKDGLPNLKTLILDDNVITDVKGLEEHGNTLETLWMNNNKLVTIDGLEKLTNLGTFHANNNEIKDIDPLSSMKSIRNVELAQNNIHSIPDMSRTPLFQVNLNGNDIKNLPPASYFPDTIYSIKLIDNGLDGSKCDQLERELHERKPTASVYCEHPDF